MGFARLPLEQDFSHCVSTAIDVNCCPQRGVKVSLSGKNLANNGHSGYAEVSQSRRRPAPQAILFWTVLVRRRATLREFSAVLESFYTFQK